LYSFFKQKVTNLLDIVVTVLNPLLTIFFVWLKWNVLGVMAALLLTTLISVLIAAWQAIATAREASAHSEASPPKASKSAPIVLAAQPEPPGSAGESLPLLETASEIELEKIQAQSTQVDRALKTRAAPSLRNKTAAAADGGSNSSKSAKKGNPENLGLRFTRYAALMYFFNISAWFYDIPFAVTIYTFFGTDHPALVAVALIRLIYGFIKTLLKTLLTPFNGVQTPLFSSLHAEGRDSALQTAYASLSKLQIFMLVPSGLGIIILARNLMFLLFERKSQDAVLTGDLLMEATWATALTVAFTFTEAIISLPMIVLMVYEKYRLVILSRSIPFLTGPLLILCAVFNWGAVNAVIVMGGLAVLSRIITLIGVRKLLSLTYPIQFMWKVLRAGAAFAIPLGGLVYFLPTNWPVTIAIAALGALIFFGVFKWLGGFDSEDKERLTTLKIPFRKYVIKYL
jgi:O-antigen/teichoic acid export membrane protein